MKLAAAIPLLLAGALVATSGAVGVALSAEATAPPVAAAPEDPRPLSACLGLNLNFDSKKLRDVIVVTPDRGKVTPIAIAEDIVPGSPADLMGVQSGDRVLRYNGETPTAAAFYKGREQTKPGSPVAMEVERRGQILTLNGINGGIRRGPHPDDAKPINGPISGFSDDNPMRGAFLAGSRPSAYWAFHDGSIAPGSTQPAWCYRSHVANLGQEFGTWMTAGPQGERLAQFKGQRLRFSARLKGEQVTGYCGLWMRTDIGDRDSYRLGRFDNMSDRGLKGTFDWTPVAVVLDLQPEINGCMYGLILTGPGTTWVSDAKLEVVDASVAPTHLQKHLDPAPPAGVCPAQVQWLAWNAGADGAFQYHSRITIKTPSPVAGTTEAEVLTYSANFTTSVRYRAPAWRTAAGDTVVESRWIDPKSQVMIGTRNWYPDSFVIAADGTVKAFDTNTTGTPVTGKVLDRAPDNWPAEAETKPEAAPNF